MMLFYIHYFTTRFQLFGKYPTGGKNFAKGPTSCFFLKRYSITLYILYKRIIFSSHFGCFDNLIAFYDQIDNFKGSKWLCMKC